MHPLENVPNKSKSMKCKSAKVPELDDTTDIELTDNDSPQLKKQKTSGLMLLRRTGEPSFYLF